jgi:hypothetical protein
VNAHKYLFFIIKPTRCTNFTNLFWHETLHVSDSSSVHHQEEEEEEKEKKKEEEEEKKE